jgi:potassium-transporting ATPase potassium-binding subunit
MIWTGLCELAALIVLLVAVTKPLGSDLASVFEGKRTFLSKPLFPLERLIYRLCRLDPEVEQAWTTYTASCLAFALVNFTLFSLLLRLQRVLPLNPQRFGAAVAPRGAVPMTPDLAFKASSGYA